MKTRLIFVNGRFGFLRKYHDTKSLIDELRDLVSDYGIEKIDVTIVTDKEYTEDEPCTK